jgi:hypothetical protein
MLRLAFTLVSIFFVSSCLHQVERRENGSGRVSLVPRTTHGGSLHSTDTEYRNGSAKGDVDSGNKVPEKPEREADGSDVFQNQEERKCAESEDCVLLGLCSLMDGKCRAVRDEDCTASRTCIEDGACSVASDGQCRVTSSTDCRRSECCLANGRCSVSGGRCVALIDAECASSSGCAESGWCRQSDGSCLALRDKDCELPCRKFGGCHAIGGLCRPLLERECQRSEECKENGACRWNKERGECSAD